MDCKHSMHSSKHSSQGNSLLNAQKSKSRPKKLHHQSHLVNNSHHCFQNHSPKTIDYMNVMKKFSNGKQSKSTLQGKKSAGGRQMKTIQTPRKEEGNSFDRNAQGYSTLQYRSNQLEDEEQCCLNEGCEEEESKTLPQTMSLNYNTQLKERVDYLEAELNSLKMTSKAECSLDKVNLFILLVRKYCKKLFALVNLENQTNTESSQASNELILTIEQFSKMVFNKKVDQLLSSPSLPLRDEAQRKELSYQSVDQRDRDVELFIRRYEENAEKMRQEKEAMERLLHQKEEELLQLRNANSEEVVALRRRLYDQMKRNEEIDKHMLCLKNVNREIESRCLLLEEENNSFKRKMNKHNRKHYEDEDKAMGKYQQKAKDNRSEYIAYLESLLNKENVKQKQNEKEGFADSAKEKDKDKPVDIVNQSTNKNESEREDKDKESKREVRQNEKQPIQEHQQGEGNDNKPSIASERPLKIKREIEEIDKEIFELQSQLRYMLDKK